jgi:hypothetical protein
MEPALYYAQTQKINDKVKEMRALKTRLMEQDQAGVTISSLESLSAALEAGPEWMDLIWTSLKQGKRRRILSCRTADSWISR